MKNLPHQKPIRFVNKIVDKGIDFVVVSCSFPIQPTLAMFCEAAAQSSIVFSETDEIKLGFLVSLKNIEIIESLVSLEYEIKIKKEISLGLLQEYSFEIINSSKVCAKGNLIIKIEE
jgi:hypothetical protein